MQAVLSGGLVFLAVFVERFFGFRPGRRQWVGVTITAAGLAVIGLTGGGAYVRAIRQQSCPLRACAPAPTEAPGETTIRGAVDAELTPWSSM